MNNFKSRRSVKYQPGTSSDDSNYTKNNTLSGLPTEILLQIFNFLDPHFLSKTLTRVCVRFASILHDELFWKKKLTNIIISRYLKGKKVELRNPYTIGLQKPHHWLSERNILWRNLAVNFSLWEQTWCGNHVQIRTKNFKEPHYGPVDAVKILDETTVVSGGQDRMVNLWKINPTTLHLEAIYSRYQCHTGPIWDIDCYEPDTFFTSSRDKFVVHWSSEILGHINRFNCGNPVLAVSSTRGLVAAGLHAPKILLFDPRLGVSRHNPVLPLSFEMPSHIVTDVLLLPEKHLLLSSITDKTVRFFDTRFHKQCYNAITISRDNTFPTCLGVYKNLLYVGDDRGNIHMSSVGGDVSDNSTFNIGTTSYISSIVPHASGITVGSIDRHIRMINTCIIPPVMFWDKEVAGQVSCMDHQKDLIAASSTMGSVTLFKAVNTRVV